MKRPPIPLGGVCPVGCFFVVSALMMLGCFAVVARGVRMVLSADCLCCSAAFLDIGVFPLCLVARCTSTVDIERHITESVPYGQAMFPAQLRFQSRLPEGTAKLTGGTTPAEGGDFGFGNSCAVPPVPAKVAWAEWCAEIDTRVATLRAAAKGEGRPLTQVNALALAGKWYSWFLAQHENDTRLASYWAELRDYFVWDVIGREAPDEYKADTDADPHWDWAKAAEVRDAVRPVIAELARVASFLSGAGFSLDDNAYKLFTNAVSDLMFGAFGVLEKRADGDFTPDETPKQFPVNLLRTDGHL